MTNENGELFLKLTDKDIIESWTQLKTQLGDTTNALMRRILNDYLSRHSTILTPHEMSLLSSWQRQKIEGSA